MARWGKNVVVPLESLIKEKENTNRPTAARSAGTVGKWGKMGFTSTRTYALKAIPATISPAQSPEGGECQNNQANEPPKPKKFFKSRNTSADVMKAAQNIYHLPRAPPSPIRSDVLSTSHKKEPSIKIKLSKSSMERKKSISLEKVNVKSRKKKEERKLKPEAPPSRVISRNRKVVNYNEDDDEKSQTSLRDVISVPSISTVEFPSKCKIVPEAVSLQEARPESMEPPHVVPKPPPVEHPPIVLRISKGTSRLISTDSEEINSPAHETTEPEPAIASTAELLAVLSDEPAVNVIPQNIEPEIDDTVPAPPITNNVPEPEVNNDPPKIESLKIKIKTDVLKNNNCNEKKSKSKKHKNLTKTLKIADHQFKTPSPQPGCENYDLYRTLAASPSERDFDSQSSILGSVSSKETTQFTNAVVDESCVIRSRGSSDITSDLETSQHSSLVAPPSDIESRLESMMDDGDEVDENIDLTAELGPVENMISSIPLEPLQEDILEILTGEQEKKEDVIRKSPEKESEPEPASVIKEATVPKRMTRAQRALANEPVEKVIVEEKRKGGRVTRNNNNNNGILKNKKTIQTPPMKMYSRKRKLPQNHKATIENILPSNLESIETPDINLPNAPAINDTKELDTDASYNDNVDQMTTEDTEKEYKIKNKFKRTWYERDAKNSEQPDQLPLTKIKAHISNDNDICNRNTIKGNKVVNNNRENGDDDMSGNDDEKRSVKLVISKKKGSIFKSRALVADQGDSKKRHIYKHTWDAEDQKEKSVNNERTSTPSTTESVYDEFNNVESTSKLTRVTRQNVGKSESENITSVKCDKKAKDYYTVVRNVKTAHQIQEIGEYQEMDDDVEYILDALQPHNPIPTRCLSAIQLASKCMTPAFRMHVRAHGTVTKFFKALQDSKNDLCLGLCTATIMFVLSQDTLNMDLDRDTLELMMNLLEADVCLPLDECSVANFERNKLKVKEICEDIKGQGKATHLNIESISVGTLAMETLLSLTSKRAGEWFKEELRELGGLEHIIKTICECCHQISDYVVSWTDVLLDKLKTIERCLRVLENVSQQNEKNQHYILSYSDGHAINTLFKLYKLCDSEIALYPTTDATPKENPGVVLREALVPTLKVLINLTHPFDEQAVGSAILGERAGIFDTSFHILLQAPNYIPERCIFELSILVLLLLINLTMHTIPNRKLIMQSQAPSDFGNQFDKVPAIKALIEYFYKCEEQARLAEQNTDAILENPDTTKKKKLQSQEEVDETVTKLLQKAGHHMEHTMKASYAGILIGHLISGNEQNEKTIRAYLHENSFTEVVSILEKYYNFMNLTASSEAIVVSHIKSTKKLIDYFKKCDTHSNTINSNDNEATSSSSVMSTRSTPRVYKTYSQR